jgi:CRP-like cAMP-binding protein
MTDTCFRPSAGLGVTPAQNHLIERLPRNDRQQLMTVAEPVSLRLGDVLGQRGSPTRHVYFPVDAFISLVTAVDAHPSLEVGMVGREGMLGAPLALGVAAAPWRSLVQGGGSAWRIAAVPFRRQLADSVALQRGLQRYLFVLLSQLATSAACVRFHEIGPRLARWLLMTQDRAHADNFVVTHEFLACMLGVRRVGVTQAAGALQRRGLIAYHRGQVSVLDRTGLEAAACSCYAADRQDYLEQLAWPPDGQRPQRTPSA